MTPGVEYDTQGVVTARGAAARIAFVATTIGSHSEGGTAGTQQRRPPARVVADRLARQLATTPGRLRLIAAALVCAAVVLGLVAWAAERSRAHAADSVATTTERLLLQSVQVYAALSDANATATTTFLTGGLEPAASRRRYLADLRTASTALSSLTAEVRSSVADRGAVQDISTGLPAYVGMVESARAHNIEGQPVGAAYLRQASQLLSSTILPAADRLYTTEASRLGEGYGSGTRAASLILFGLAIAVLLAGLLVAQRHLSAISNRTLNVPLLAATAALTLLAVWALLGMLGEQSGLARAQREGSDQVELLSTMRILSSRAESDDSLSLVARGGDTLHPADAGAALTTLVGTNGAGGLLDAAGARVGRSAQQQIGAALAAFRVQHTRIVTLLGQGAVPPAIKLGVGSAKSSNSPSDRVSSVLDGYIAAAQGRFLRAANDASSSLKGLSAAIPVLIIAVALLALLGLRQRIREYL
jgi:hypothetical protein